MINLLRKFFIFLVLACCFGGTVFAAAVEDWNSVEGLKRLQRSQFKNDFYQLVNYYQPQINPFYCGVATGVILLNATNSSDKIPNQKENQGTRPQALGGGIVEFHSYSQQSFLNDKTDKIKKRDVIQLKEPAARKDGKEVFDAGMSAADFAQILKHSYGLKVQLKHVTTADQKAVENFRADLKKYLADSKNFLVANFDGRVIGRSTHGHISPIAVYDEESDSVLVLDVALHKNPWYWVNISDLLAAMNTKDDQAYRGYVIITR